MLGLSIHQLLDSIWAIIGPAAVPATTGLLQDGHTTPIGAIGTTTTCTIQGFFW